MASLSAQDFVNKLATDSDFRSKVGISPTMQLGEFKEKAAAAGYNYTPEEIVAAAESQQGGALSDEDLEDVTGGAASNLRIKITIKISF